MLKKIACLLSLTLPSFAIFSYPAYLKQVIYNDSPYEVYFGLRPFFYYPDWSCHGTIPAYSSLICHNQFENESTGFVLQLISRYTPQPIDTDLNLQFSALLYAPSAEMIGHINYDVWSQNFKFTYQIS